MGELFNRVQDKIKRALDKAVSSDIQATSIGDLLASLGTGILQQVVTGGVGVLSATATVAQEVLFGGTNGKFAQSPNLSWNGTLQITVTGNAASALDILNTVPSIYTLSRWVHGGVISNILAVSGTLGGAGGQTVWWQGPDTGDVASYVFDEKGIGAPGGRVRLGIFGGLGLLLGDQLTYAGSVAGVLEIKAKTGLTTQTAIALSSAFQQDIIKSNGDMAIGTVGAHVVKMQANGNNVMQFDGDGRVTVFGSTAAVSAAGTGAIRFNSGTNKLQKSENGGAWADIL
jgi:hypothetical protein